MSRAEESYAAEAVALAALTFHEAVLAQSHAALNGGELPNMEGGSAQQLSRLLDEWKVKRRRATGESEERT